MIEKSQLKQLETFVWQIDKTARQDMRVPARIYASERILDMALEDRSLEQLINTCTLPGVVKHAIALPDVHQGYGFPIGGVAATQLPGGVISPGGVGYDINCGVRVLTSTVEADALRPHIQTLMSALFSAIPTGVGAQGSIQLSARELNEVLEQGIDWAVRKGYATERDREHTEEQGRMIHARASTVSPRAIERGRGQLGSLGAGNHFLEVDEIVDILDPQAAQTFGLHKGCVCIWIHCGSRGLGHQVCTDAVRTMQQVGPQYGIVLPDRELGCAPLNSPEGQSYLQAMSCAANYAWTNRQIITKQVREAWEKSLPRNLGSQDLALLYDVCHNIAKIESHDIDGEMADLCVHRKGATRAFGPGRSEIPAEYRTIGQPVLIPGNMESGSYILVGTTRALRDTFGSACHGAGRVMSRTRARNQIQGQQLRNHLEDQGIVIKAGSLRSLAEEAPAAYKDVDHVVEVVHEAGLARMVARTRPLGVIKG